MALKGKELLKDEEVQKFVQRYIILYGVQLGVYTVIAICMQVWWQYFVFMISFVALRSFAGGHGVDEDACDFHAAFVLGCTGGDLLSLWD